MVLVVLILSVVYRSPLLVVMPVVTIAVSFVAATEHRGAADAGEPVAGVLVAELPGLHHDQVFIVVILYGSGTDFYLFLLAIGGLGARLEYRDAIAKSRRGGRL